MINILWYLFFGTVIFLIVSFGFKLGYHLSKNRKWIKWDILASLLAAILAFTGLLIVTGA